MTTAMTDSPWRISLDTPTTERHTAHQQRPAEVTIYYRYHPLRTQNLPVVRVYDFHDEVYYVVRRTDGTPLAVPAWMTRPEAAHVRVVSSARLPVRVLFELSRVTVTCLSARAHNVHEEDHDAATPSKMPTTTLRGTARRSRRTTSTGRATATTPGAGAVDAGAGQDDPRGGRP